jgi:threonine synthase
LQKYDGVVEQASESELAEAAAAADRTGTFACPHTGVALAALVKLVKRGEIKKHERVVVISTASGLKFTDFKVRYHERRIDGVDSQLPNQPVPLPNEYEAVKRAVFTALD